MSGASEPQVLIDHDRLALFQGESPGAWAELGDCTVDALVTDPPAGIGFMGREWDSDKGGRDQWVAWLAGVMRECLRVMKPGAHGLVWALPRTSHWTATALEDAGFEVRDVVMHLFGTGFPKSLNVSKAIDAAAGAERKVIGTKLGLPGYSSNATAPNQVYGDGFGNAAGSKVSDITAPATPEAERWNGWGTALKPAAEHWILVRKPLEGTVAANVTKWGTGALNIDGCRVGTEPAFINRPGRKSTSGMLNVTEGVRITSGGAGRWPANLTLDEDAAALLDAQSGLKKGEKPRQLKRGGGRASEGWGLAAESIGAVHPDGGGGASRFFYTAKVSRAERDRGCEHLPAKSGGEATDREEGSAGLDSPRAGAGRGGGVKNHHPTVKPLALMRWLVRLITPPGGTVLDPFAGSGSTGMAALEEGFNFIGCEASPEYAQIALARCTHALTEAA